MRNPWLRSVGIGLLVLMLSSPLQAQQSPLAQIPAKAPLVLQIKGIETARERLGKMLGNALPDLAPMIAPHFEELFKAGPLAGRDLSVLPKDGTVFIVCTDLEALSDDPPAIAFLLPITDYAAFKKGVLTADERKAIKKGKDGLEVTEIEGKDVFLLDRKNYVVASLSEDLIADFSKKFASLDSKLGNEAATTFLTPDVALFLNLESIKEQYGEQLQAFKGLFDLGLGQVDGLDKATQEMAKVFVNGLFQVIDDGKGLILSSEFRPEGLNFRFSLAFKDETPSNEFLGKLKLSPFAELSQLPGGQMMYSGARMDKPLYDILGKFAAEMLAGGEDNQQVAKKIAAVMEKINGLSNGITYSVTNIPTSGIEVIEYSNPKEASAATLEMLQLIPNDGQFQGSFLKGKPKIEKDAQTHRDFVLTGVSMRMDFDKAIENQPGSTEEMKEAMKAAMIKLLGSEDMRFWFGSDGKKFVQITAPNWKMAQKLLDDYLDGKSAGKNEAFAATRKQLPNEATIVSLMETSRTILGMWDYMSAILQAIPGFPLQDLPQLKAAKGDPSYLGMSIVLKKGVSSADLFIPTTAVQQIRTILAPLTENFGQ